MKFSSIFASAALFAGMVMGQSSSSASQSVDPSTVGGVQTVSTPIATVETQTNNCVFSTQTGTLHGKAYEASYSVTADTIGEGLTRSRVLHLTWYFKFDDAINANDFKIIDLGLENSNFAGQVNLEDGSFLISYDVTIPYLTFITSIISYCALDYVGFTFIDDSAYWGVYVGAAGSVLAETIRQLLFNLLALGEAPVYTNALIWDCSKLGDWKDGCTDTTTITIGEPTSSSSSISTSTVISSSSSAPPSSSAEPSSSVSTTTVASSSESSSVSVSTVVSSSESSSEPSSSVSVSTVVSSSESSSEPSSSVSTTTVASSSESSSAPSVSTVVSSSGAPSSAPSSSPAPSPAPESVSTSVVNEQSTTVLTVTSCEEHKCTNVPVTTGVTVVTETKDNTVTQYTTYCPLTTVTTSGAPAPSSAAPKPEGPSSEAPAPKPSSEAPAPKPSSEAPAPKPSSEAPAPAPSSSGAPAPKPSSEAPAPAPTSSGAPAPAPTSEAPQGGSSAAPAPAPSSEAPAPAPAPESSSAAPAPGTTTAAPAASSSAAPAPASESSEAPAEGSSAAPAPASSSAAPAPEAQSSSAAPSAGPATVSSYEGAGAVNYNNWFVSMLSAAFVLLF